MDNYFSTNLKYLRKLNNITQEELGIRLGKDYSTIGKWEKGTHYPVLDDAFKLSLIFNISLDDLMGVDLKNKNLDDHLVKFNRLIQNNISILTDEDKEYIEFIINKRKINKTKEM